jgi:hypothetical protein
MEHSSDMTFENLIKYIKVSGNTSVFLEILYRHNILKDILPELHNCYGVKQNYHHVYDVFGHIAKTVEYCTRDKAKLAALFHDIGKPNCLVIRDGKETFWGHEYESVKIFARYFPEDSYTQALILFHMRFFEPGFKCKAVAKLLKQVTQLVQVKDIFNWIEDYMDLKRADIKSHTHEAVICEKDLNRLNRLHSYLKEEALKS